MESNNIRFPKKLSFLFKPARYKVAYGGRGSGKSWGFARALLIQAQQRPLRVLCARELQLSITESVHRLLSNQIEAMRLSAYFEIQGQVIKGSNGSEFIFTGIKSNPEKIKSTEAVDICWVEEAETVSERSWEVLIPTIRNPGSEIWVSFNPHEATDPTYKRFVIDPPPGAIVREINWADNKWFPRELQAEKDYLARVDPDTYEHIWNGKCRTNSDAQIFKGKYRIEAFDPPAGNEWDGPYFGADWGFSNDPTTLVKCWIRERTLFVEHEAWGIGVGYDDIAALFLSVPGADNHVIRADCSQPGHIAHVSEKGSMRIEPADKWPGSVEDGVQYLRSFEAIIVHPRCVHAAEEFRLYSYKQDRLSGDILPVIVDKNNHILDGLRYALSPMVPGNSAIASFTKIAENRGFERFYTELGYR